MSMRVVIVGGGVTRLAAARELRATGVAVTLVDRHFPLGGRFRPVSADVPGVGRVAFDPFPKALGPTEHPDEVPDAPLGLRPPNRWTAARGGWTAEQVALLGTDQDDAIAQKLGRSRGATTTQRVKRRIPAFSGWPGGGPGWMADEIALLGTDHDEAIAARVGRTRGAVMQKRWALKVPAFRDRRTRS